MTDRRQQLIDKVSRSFMEQFGETPQLMISAPGRVNLIGEHTDYNDGFVLPCAIDYETIVAISPGDGPDIDVLACDYDQDDQFDPGDPFQRQAEEWKNHVRGVVASFWERGFKTHGTRIAIGGNIPQGAGLSSSASLSVALGKALSGINQLDQIDETQIAQIAQQSENDFVGTACGIMDQLASARSIEGHAMLLDCRSLAIDTISVPDELALIVIHSGIKRGLVDSAYNERRQQCEAAARHYGVTALRDLDLERLEADKGNLDAVSYRRARHVVSENQRTLDMSKALQKNDMKAVSKLMAASHCSMRDDFEITLPAIDQLVEIIANDVEEYGGTRMTGGGFGGCVVALVPSHKVDSVRATVLADYVSPDGKQAQIYHCKPVGGVSVLSVQD